MCDASVPVRSTGVLRFVTSDTLVFLSVSSYSLYFFKLLLYLCKLITHSDIPPWNIHPFVGHSSWIGTPVWNKMTPTPLVPKRTLMIYFSMLKQSGIKTPKVIGIYSAALKYHTIAQTSQPSVRLSPSNQLNQTLRISPKRSATFYVEVRMYRKQRSCRNL